MPAKPASNAIQHSFYIEAIVVGVAFGKSEKSDPVISIRLEGTEGYRIKRDDKVYNLLWLKNGKHKVKDHDDRGIIRSAEERYSLDVRAGMDIQSLISKLQPSHKVKVLFRKSQLKTAPETLSISYIEMCLNNG